MERREGRGEAAFLTREPRVTAEASAGREALAWALASGPGRPRAEGHEQGDGGHVMRRLCVGHELHLACGDG